MHLGHEHEHDHTHNHETAHSHGDHSHHGHSHSNGSTPDATSKKDMALLTYMLSHNKDHAKELSQMGARLGSLGFTQAADEIANAVHFFDHANESLEKAVQLCEKSQGGM